MKVECLNRLVVNGAFWRQESHPLAEGIVAATDKHLVMTDGRPEGIVQPLMEHGPKIYES
jgi:hypothetical protein